MNATESSGLPSHDVRPAYRTAQGGFIKHHGALHQLLARQDHLTSHARLSPSLDLCWSHMSVHCAVQGPRVLSRLQETMNGQSCEGTAFEEAQNDRQVP
jgi:hypothetical protein